MDVGEETVSTAVLTRLFDFSVYIIVFDSDATNTDFWYEHKYRKFSTNIFTNIDLLGKE